MSPEARAIPWEKRLTHAHGCPPELPLVGAFVLAVVYTSARHATEQPKVRFLYNLIMSTQPLLGMERKGLSQDKVRNVHTAPLVLAGSWSSAQVALFRFFEDSAFSQASLVSRRATSKFESRQGA